MLITLYLASAVMFYAFVARRAPIAEESILAQAETCELIELYATTADLTASRAA